MKAYDYCRVQKRRDLGVVIEEFVDTSKFVVDIGYEIIIRDFKEKT